jgi:hypothetical protein
MGSVVTQNGDHAQYCSYCGRDLEVRRRRSYADASLDFVYLRCPKKHWWNRFHSDLLLKIETSETVLNYDPFTGERIKNVKSK